MSWDAMLLLALGCLVVGLVLRQKGFKSLGWFFIGAAIVIGILM
jgi:uncharacterized membrane protein